MSIPRLACSALATAALLALAAFLVILRAPSGGETGRGSLLTGGSKPVTYAVEADETLAPVSGQATGRGRTVDSRTDVRGLLPNEAWVDVQVRSAPSGLPVADAPLYLVSQRIDRGTTDAHGRARVKVRAGAVLVGVEVPEGAPLVAMELLEDAVGPLAEQEIVVQPGAEIAVELHLQSASSIVGRLMAPNHGPVFDAGGFTLVADGPSWLKGRRCISDENGHFESGPLFAGKYTLYSNSGAGPLIHQLELELLLGERRVLDLEVLLAREIKVVVDAVCETTGEPWPFPFEIDVNRADELARYDQESTSRHGWIGLADADPGRVFALRNGPYALDVSSNGWCADAFWISPEWYRSAEFTVEADTTEVHVQVTVPDVGSEAIARVDAQLTRPIDDRAGSLRVLYLDKENIRRTHFVDIEPGVLKFTLLVDLGHVSSSTIEFAQYRRGEMTSVLLATELTPGDHSITLTPAVH